LIAFWGSVVKIFSVFENSTSILLIYYSKIAYLFNHPVFTDIAIIFAFILGILYIIISIGKYGHMIFSKEHKDTNAQHGLIAILILAVFNGFLLLPYCLFLYPVMNRLDELGLVLFLYVVSHLFVFLYSDFVKLMQNYERLNEFCKEIKPRIVFLPSNRIDCLLVLISNKGKYRDIFVLLMIISVFLVYSRNFNLLTLAYMELILFFCMVVILMLDFPGGPIKGPVNIFLTNGQVLNRVFIIEESEKEYIMTLHKEMTQNNENVLKKVMTGSVAYIEPANKKSE
jgi:hypothetical protein